MTLLRFAVAILVTLSLIDVNQALLSRRPQTESPRSILLPPLQAKEFASIGSDGNVRRSTGSLGVPSKKKKKKSPKQNKALSKKERQRTANGTIDSNSSNVSADPSQQGLEVVRGNRGNKTVTIVRGMNTTQVDEKKKILKSLKSKLGTGGTLVDGVLELQGGDKIEKVVELLQGLGYSKARKV